jgi:hypothetical protein
MNTQEKPALADQYAIAHVDPRMSNETPQSSFGKFGQSQSQRSWGKPIRPLVL